MVRHFSLLLVLAGSANAASYGTLEASQPRHSTTTEVTCRNLLSPEETLSIEKKTRLSLRGTQLLKNGIALFTSNSPIKSAALLWRSLIEEQSGGEILRFRQQVAVLNKEGDLFLLNDIFQDKVKVSRHLRPGPEATLRVVRFHDAHYVYGYKVRNRNPALLIVKPNSVYGVALANSGDLPLSETSFSSGLRTSQVQSVLTNVAGIAGWTDNYLELTQENGEKAYIRPRLTNANQAHLLRGTSVPIF